MNGHNGNGEKPDDVDEDIGLSDESKDVVISEEVDEADNVGDMSVEIDVEELRAHNDAHPTVIRGGNPVMVPRSGESIVTEFGGDILKELESALNHLWLKSKDFDGALKKHALGSRERMGSAFELLAAHTQETDA